MQTEQAEPHWRYRQNPKKYRRDGSMRPTRARQQIARTRARRKAWLAEFEPGVRAAFFDAVDLDRAKFASPYARAAGITKLEAEAELARLAADLGWLSLVTRSGRTVGIGPKK